MGTRGTTGFRVNGKDYISYQQFDSYPDGVGVSVCDAVKEIMKDKDKAVILAGKLQLVGDNKKPTAKDIEALAEYTDLGVSNQNTDDWYCLLRKTQGDPMAILKSGYVKDSAGFMADSLFCEFSYIINLDDDILEFYIGFQETDHEKGRYAQMSTKEGGKYKPVALISTYPLSEVAADPSGIVENMNSIAYPEDEDEEAA